MSDTPKDAKGIFLAAVDIQEPAERAAFVARSCGGDTALRQRVEDLLRAYGQPDGPLDKLAAALAPTELGEPIREQVGAVIGPYKLMEQIGEGGFGLVFVAEQQQPIRRKVALKIIKPGMDTRDVIARFKAEQQALALMDHPNIARVFDAGTTESGRPYFVMELVRGIPITDYCDLSQLTPRERLELFIPVCNAIQHAHLKGIIHRDIKPSNVLVTLHDGKPVVKVIDFGVAKALHQSLTDRTIYTRFAQMIGTPLYMSPEQAEMSGLDIDTRTDVYSLGVLLYELLAGTTPLDKQRLAKAAYDELLKMIREEEPPKPSIRLTQSTDTLPSIAALRRTEPSKLPKMFQGDVDWITMKALEKDRTRRYETANAFAADVLRYLNDEPVEASPPSAAYRLRKLARRHRTAIVTATSFAGLLVAAAIISSWLAIREKTARHSADRNALLASEAATAASQAARRADASANEAEAEAEHANSLLYCLQLADAQREWELGNRSGARSHLNSCRGDLRGCWEYRYLDTLLNRHQTFTEAVGDVSSVAFSPDGKWIVSGGGTAHDQGSGRLTIWDAMSGHEILTAKEHIDNVTSVAFSPDGKCVASGNEDKTVKVWDATSGKTLLTLRGHTGEVTSVAFRPDGKRLASGSRDKTVRVWNATNGHELLTLKGHTDDVTAVSFSPDGKRIAGGGGSAIWIWDASNGEAVLPIPVSRGLVHSLAFSPDGKYIVAGGKGVGSLKGSWFRLWHAASGRLAFSHGSTGGKISSVAFSPDSTQIAMGDGKRITLIDIHDKDLALNGWHTGEVTTVAFSPDGKRIVSGARARSTGATDSGTIKVWNITNTPESFSFGGGNGLNTMSLSPDGKQVAVGSTETSINGIVTVCDASNGAEILTLAGQNDGVTRLAFSPDGKRIAGGSSHTVRVWDAITGQVAFTLKGVGGGALSPDGRLMVGSQGTVNDGKLKLWNALDGHEVLTLQNSGTASEVAFSPKGNRIAAVDVAKKIKVWEAQSGKESLSLKIAGGAATVAFSPDGKRIAGGGLSGAIQIWDAASGQNVLTLRRHMGNVTHLAFSPDGKRLASGSNDEELRVWDAATGGELLTMPHFTCVAFSPDGKRIVGGGWDPKVKFRNGVPNFERLLRFWDAASGREGLVIRRGMDFVNSLAFSPNGQRIAIGCSEFSTTGIVKVLKADGGEEILTLKGRNAAFSPDGKWVATGNDGYNGRGYNSRSQESIELWDATNGQLLSAMKDPGSGITHPIFSADGKWIASASAGNTIKVWDATAGKTILTLKGHPRNVTCVAFSPDGKRMVSGSQDGTIKIWNASNGDPVLTTKLKGGRGYTYNYLTSVIFSPDGKRIIGGTHFEGAKIWDAENGREVLQLGNRQTPSVACTPDGSRIASGSLDGTIQLWDASSGQETLVLRAHKSAVIGLMFSLDGNRLASGSSDGIIKIWDASSSPDTTERAGGPRHQKGKGFR